MHGRDDVIDGIMHGRDDVIVLLFKLNRYEEFRRH